MSRKEKLEKIKKKLTKRRISFIIIVMFVIYSLAMYGNIQLQKDKKDEVSYIPYTQFQQMIEKNQVEYVFLEDLNFKNGNKKKGKGFNRLTINQWNRNTPFEILSKYFKNKIFKVNAAYSSTIGNCLYNYPDPINASLEIARRGFEVIILKKVKEGVSSFYPEFNLSMMREEIRNQTTHLELNSWKELHTFLKNSKLKYRVSLDEVVNLMFLENFKAKRVKL